MGFDERAATWDSSDRRQALAEAVANAIKEKIPLQPKMRMLDFGAGTGLLTRRLAPYVGDITAVDTSAKMLEKLAESVPETACRQGDIITYECRSPFDLIVSSMTMHHIPDTEALLKKLHDLLAPGGFIALADLAEEDGTFHDHGNEGVHHFGFDCEELKERAKKAGFKDIDCRIVHTLVKEKGNYPIILLTAKRE